MHTYYIGYCPTHYREEYTPSYQIEYQDTESKEWLVHSTGWRDRDEVAEIVRLMGLAQVVPVRFTSEPHWY